MSKVDKKNPALHLTGGALSGMVACTALQPLDLIKTRLQQQRQDHLAFLKEAKSRGLKVSPQKRFVQGGALRNCVYSVFIYSNIYSTIKDIVHSNGYSGLWRGTVPTIMR